MTDNYDMEELSVRFGDIDGILSQTFLESRVEEITQENLRYRQAFRPYDATNINSSSVDIPVPDDAMGNPKIVAEGAEFHRDEETFSKKSLTFDKFGFEVAITAEAQEDSRADLVETQVDRQSRQMAEEMNLQAFTTLTNNVGSTEGDANGVFTFDDVLAGRKELLKQNYSPNLLIADVEAGHDLLSDSNFTDSATEDNADRRRSGVIGEIAGFTVVEADDGNNLTGNSNPGAVLVDTDFYGYEGERRPIQTREYEEPRSETDVYQISTRMGWVVTDQNAAVIIEG